MDAHVVQAVGRLTARQTLAADALFRQPVTEPLPSRQNSPTATA
ncbi:hypothetical protein ACIGXF_35755 [Streptomyces sp. NPDC053086]